MALTPCTVLAYKWYMPENGRALVPQPGAVDFTGWAQVGDLAIPPGDATLAIDRDRMEIPPSWQDASPYKQYVLGLRDVTLDVVVRHRADIQALETAADRQQELECVFMTSGVEAVFFTGYVYSGAYLQPDVAHYAIKGAGTFESATLDRIPLLLEAAKLPAEAGE